MQNSKKAKSTREIKTPIDSVIRPIMQLRACCDKVSTNVLRKKMGFGSSQLRILYVLAHKPEMTQKVIADFWDVTEASVSRQIGILVGRGFAAKSKAKNGAQMTIITPEGKKALNLAMREIRTAFEKIFKDINNKDRTDTARLLENLIGKIRGYAQLK